MLSKRQFLILSYLVGRPDQFITSKEIAQHFNISVRTVKNDLKVVKEFSQRCHCFAFDSIPSKGIQVIIYDKDNVQNEIEGYEKDIIQTDRHQADRVQGLLSELMNASSYISKYTLMEKFYISESTLYSSTNKIKELLAKYNLSLVYKTNYGYKVEGKEIDKRMCIVQNDIYFETPAPYMISEDMGRIYNVVASAFLNHKYQINERSMQNITNYISLTVQRVKNGHAIKESCEDFSHLSENQISEDILNHFLPVYNIPVDLFKNEVSMLTQTILGKSEVVKDIVLQDEINDFLNKTFNKINQKFSVNFSSNENLKLFLALHLIPLFYRVRSRTQLTNEMAPEIRKTFPLAHDIAIYFSILIKEEFKLVIAQDELSYLTLYFNYGLEDLNIGSITKKILILTSLRKSETVLLRHKILGWFPNQIAEINFVDSNSDDYDLDDYDATFSTDEDLIKYKGAVTKINIFPDDKDYERINLALNGFTDPKSILCKFSKECFYVGSASTKKDALEIVCKNAAKKHELPDDFQNLIFSREYISTTYFGNHIAAPHPLTPLSNETFISVAVLDKPVQWDQEHMVSIIMLISIEKNNPRAFQLWHYMSSFIQNEEVIERLLKDPSYEYFISLMEKSLKIEFKI